MSLAKEIENFGLQCGRNNHTFPEQNRTLLDREGLSMSVEPIEMAEKLEVWSVRLDEFLH